MKLPLDKKLGREVVSIFCTLCYLASLSNSHDLTLGSSLEDGAVPAMLSTTSSQDSP